MSDDRMDRFLAKDRHPSVPKPKSGPLPSLSFLSLEFERVVTELELDRSEIRRVQGMAELSNIAEQIFRIVGRMRTNG